MITIHRFDRNGDPVPDRRKYEPCYYDPNGYGYHRGDRLRPPRKSSPARLRYKAQRRERRAQQGGKAA